MENIKEIIQFLFIQHRIMFVSKFSFFDVESERDEHYERIFSMLTGTKWEK